MSSKFRVDLTTPFETPEPAPIAVIFKYCEPIFRRSPTVRRSSWVFSSVFASELAAAVEPSVNVNVAPAPPDVLPFVELAPAVELATWTTITDVFGN